MTVVWCEDYEAAASGGRRAASIGPPLISGGIQPLGEIQITIDHASIGPPLISGGISLPQNLFNFQ